MQDNGQLPVSIRILRQTKRTDIIRLPEGAADIVLHLEQGAEAVVAGIVRGGTISIVLDDGARLEILRSIDEKADGTSFLKARLGKDSSLRSFFFTRGGVGIKEDVQVALEGEGAEVFLNGLHHLAGGSEAQSSVYVDHLAPHTTSDQLYKSILRDKAHSVFNGKIMVRREAQQTNAYQLNKNMLLSPQARVETKPELEIFADDVKCSHGAAIGQLDDEQLFYLQTRGIDRARAGEMLIQGFIEDVVLRIMHPALRTEVEGFLKQGDTHV